VRWCRLSARASPARYRLGLSKEFWISGLRTLHATLLRLATVGLSLLFGILCARTIGSEAFGVYVSWMAIAGFVSVGTSLGLTSLVTREVAAARGNRVFDALPPIGFLCCIIALALLTCAAFAALLGATEVATLLIFAFAVNLATVLAGAHAGYERVLFSAWLNGVARPLVALLVLLPLTWLVGSNYEAAFAAQIMGACIAAALLALRWGPLAISSAAHGIFAARQWSDQHTKVVRMGMAIAMTQLLIMATTQVDILMLTAMAKPIDVAHYFAAARAALVVSFFFGSACALAEPRITMLIAASDKDGVKGVIANTTISGVLITILAAGAAVILAPYYLTLYGPTFMTASSALHVLVVGLIGWSLFGPAQVTLRAARCERLLMIATTVALVINITVSYLLIPSLGILGAAIGTTIQFIIYGAVMAAMSASFTELHTDVFNIARRSLFPSKIEGQAELDK
jgi:O-antigen/teichoic acid export membrane protein